MGVCGCVHGPIAWFVAAQTAGHPQPGALYSHSAGVIGVAEDGNSSIYTFMCFTLDRANMESMASTFLVNNAKARD
jgi:hypothetical protein